MNVVFLSPHCDPQAKLGEPDAGGQCVYEDQLAKTLSTFNNVRVTTICRQTNNRPTYTKVNNNYSIIRIKCNNGDYVPKEKIEQILSEFAKKALQEIRRRDDGLILHGHYWDGAKALLYIKKFYPNVPIFWTPHSLGNTKRASFPGDQNERFYNFIPRLVWENYAVMASDKIIISSDDERKNLIEDYAAVESKIEIISPGVFLDQFEGITKEQAREKFNFSKRGKMLLCLGRMVKSKGYHHAVYTLKKLKKKEESAFLVICGGSSNSYSKEEKKYLKVIKSLVEKLKLTDSVIFQNAIPHDQVSYMYSAADVFLMTSENEPFGITVLEAMASRIPVIANNRGGPLNIIQRNINGGLINIHRHDKVAEYIFKLFNDKKYYQRIVENAYKSVKEDFNWKTKTKELLKIYKGQLNKKDSPIINWIKNNYFLRNNLSL